MLYNLNSTVIGSNGYPAHQNVCTVANVRQPLIQTGKAKTQLAIIRGNLKTAFIFLGNWLLGYKHEWGNKKKISGNKSSMVIVLAQTQGTVAFIFPKQLLKLWDHCPGFNSSLLGTHIFFCGSQAGSLQGCCCLEHGDEVIQHGWIRHSKDRTQGSACSWLSAASSYQAWAPKAELFAYNLPWNVWQK